MSKADIGLELPLAPISRLAKNELPDNIQISKEVKASFAKSAGVFILYLTNQANQFCQKAKRSTISADDVLAAVQELEFDEFLPELQDYLAVYRESAQKKKELKQNKNKAEEEAKSSNDVPPTKKQRKAPSKKAESKEKGKDKASSSEEAKDSAKENEAAEQEVEILEAAPMDE